MHKPCMVHVMCRLHLYPHAYSMHISCNMHGFGMFSMHVACMLHENYMYATCIWNFDVKNYCSLKVLKLCMNYSHRYMYTYR